MEARLGFSWPTPRESVNFANCLGLDGAEVAPLPASGVSTSTPSLALVMHQPHGSVDTSIDASSDVASLRAWLKVKNV
eukprot:scaffold2514_cov205-Pinguiococcus_pyrenoidosus.AAC.4